MPKTKKEEELEQQKKDKAPDEKKKQGTENLPEPEKSERDISNTVTNDLSDKAEEKQTAKEKKAADKKAQKERDKKNSKLDTMSDAHLRREIEEEEEKKRKAAEAAKPQKPGTLGNLADFLLSTFLGVRLPSAERYEKYKNGDWTPPEYNDSKLKKLKQEQERREELREEKAKNAPESNFNKEIVDLLKDIKENQGKTAQAPSNTMKRELPKKGPLDKNSEFGKTMDLKNTLGKDGPKHSAKADVERHTKTDMEAIKEESPEEIENADRFDKLVEKLESLFGKVSEVGRNNLEQIWDANQRTQQSGVKDREFFGNEMMQDSVNKLAEGKGTPEDKDFFNDLNTDPNFSKYALKVSSRSEAAKDKAAEAAKMADDFGLNDLFDEQQVSQNQKNNPEKSENKEIQKAPIEASDETKESSTKQAEQGSPEKGLDDLLQKLADVLGIAPSDNMRNNVQKLYEGNQRAHDDMQKKSENRQPNETFSIGKKNAGDMIAFHQFEQRLERGDKTLGNALEHPKFAETSQEIAANSKVGRFMGENQHTLQSFEENFKKKKGLARMSDNVDREIDDKMEKSFGIKPKTIGKDPNLPADSKQYGNNVFRAKGDIYFNPIPGKEKEAEKDMEKLNDRAKSLNKLGEDLVPEAQKQMNREKGMQNSQPQQQQNSMDMSL